MPWQQSHRRCPPARLCPLQWLSRISPIRWPVPNLPVHPVLCSVEVQMHLKRMFHFFSSWRTSTSVALEDISSFALATTAATWGSGESERETARSKCLWVNFITWSNVVRKPNIKKRKKTYINYKPSPIEVFYEVSLLGLPHCHCLSIMSESHHCHAAGSIFHRGFKRQLHLPQHHVLP